MFVVWKKYREGKIICLFNADSLLLDKNKRFYDNFFFLRYLKKGGNAKYVHI